MSPELIGALFSGLTALMVAAGAIITTRSRRVAEDVDTLKGDVVWLQGQVRMAVSHIFALELLLEGRGIPTPPRPAALGEPRPMKGNR